MRLPVMMRACTSAIARPAPMLAALAVVASASCTALGAQSIGAPPAVQPVNDLIERANAAFNNLKYDDALGAAREAMAQRRVRPAQSLVIYQLMAAAFYPDPDDGGRNQQADSAIFYLRRAIKLQPDATLADVYRWPGLDSLFSLTRSQTFAAVARPAAEYAMVGTDGRAFVDVVSARPAVMYLRTRSVRDGSTTTHDSSSASTRARLALRAHDGVNALFITGDYEIRVEVRDALNGQTDTLRYPASAVGVPPVLDRAPTLSPSALKPERAPKALAKGIAAGLLIGTATVAMAKYARPNDAISASIPPDGRAAFVGVSIAVGAIAGGILDRGKPLPANVAQNVITRAEHEKAVMVVQDANRKRVAEYRVALRLDLESAR